MASASCEAAPVSSPSRAIRAPPRGVTLGTDARPGRDGYRGVMSSTDASTRPRPWAEPRLVDAAVALALLVVMGVSMAGTATGPGQRPDDLLSVALAVLMAAPYVVHRRRPVGAVAVGLGAILLYSLLRFPAFPGVNAFVLLFGVTLHTDRRHGWGTLAATLVVMSVSLAAQPPALRTRRRGSPPSCSLWWRSSSERTGGYRGHDCPRSTSATSYSSEVARTSSGNGTSVPGGR